MLNPGYKYGGNALGRGNWHEHHGALTASPLLRRERGTTDSHLGGVVNKEIACFVNHWCIEDPGRDRDSIGWKRNVRDRSAIPKASTAIGASTEVCSPFKRGCACVVCMTKAWADRGGRRSGGQGFL